jgi:ribosomal protein L29
MAMRDGRPGPEEVRKRIQELRHEIEELRKVDHEKRLSRQSQVPWDAQKQHEARVARMDEIKEELVSCRSEFVTGNSAGGIRIFPADRPSVGRVGVDIAAEFAS